MVDVYKKVWRQKVLIIDRAVDYCLLMKALFLRQECPVYIAITMEEGLQSVSRNQPDVVLVDLNLIGNADRTVKHLLQLHPGISLIVGGRDILYQKPDPD